MQTPSIPLRAVATAWPAALALLALGIGCGGDPLGDLPVELTDDMQLLQALDYSCAVSSATGYRNGTPFAIELVTVQGQPVEIGTADALLTMMAAAARDGVNLRVNSAFRSNDEQAYLYSCYVHCNCNGCNPAAPPGYSNHQSGHAIDFSMAGAAYNWIFEHAPSYGWSNAEGASVGENWHWTWWGGGPIDAYCSDQAPRGYLDAVSCDDLRGWAQDPDDAELAIRVHLYFGGPAGSGAHGVSIPADQHRDDLCSAIGSCAHGFKLLSPLSLFDGASHPVHAYGISSSGQNNAELTRSGQALSCTAELPDGVRRHVINPASYDAWQLSAFFDRLPLDPGAVLDLPAGEDFPALPRLVKADDGSPEVWVVDGNQRRHVPSPAVMAAWRFDWGAIELLPVAELHALVVGPPWRGRPVQLEADGAIYLVDDPVPEPEQPEEVDAGTADAAAAEGDAAEGDVATVGGVIAWVDPEPGLDAPDDVEIAGAGGDSPPPAGAREAELQGCAVWSGPAASGSGWWWLAGLGAWRWRRRVVARRGGDGLSGFSPRS